MSLTHNITRLPYQLTVGSLNIKRVPGGATPRQSSVTVTCHPGILAAIQEPIPGSPKQPLFQVLFSTQYSLSLDRGNPERQDASSRT